MSDVVAAQRSDVVAAQRSDVVAAQKSDVVAAQQSDVVAAQKSDVVAAQGSEDSTAWQIVVHATRRGDDVATGEDWIGPPSHTVEKVAGTDQTITPNVEKSRRHVLRPRVLLKHPDFLSYQ